MKNIRMYEDGNRLIVVLEGYGKGVIPALMETLQSTVSPVGHIKPHAGESSFRMKGDEQEIRMPEDAPQIKKPAFVERLDAEKARRQAGGADTQGSRAAAAPAPAGKPGSGKDALKKAQKPEAQPQAEDALDVPMPMPEPEGGPAAGSASKPETMGKGEEARPDGKEPAMAGLYGLCFMSSYELRAQLRRADREKLKDLMARKGSYPSLDHLMNADDRTIRGYIRDLMTA